MSDSPASGSVETLRARVQQVVMQIDDLQEENDSLRAEVDRLGGRVDELEETLDAVAGLGKDEQSTPQKRCLDLRIKLKNAAEAEADRGNRGLVQWEWRRVREALESDGHGTVHAPQAYAAMEDAAETDGFAHTTNDEGNQVVRCSLPALKANGDVNDINNAEVDGHPSNSHESEVNTPDLS